MTKLLHRFHPPLIGILLLLPPLGSAEELSLQSTGTGWDFLLKGATVSEPWLVQESPNLTDWKDLIFFDSREAGETTTTASVETTELADPDSRQRFFRAIKLPSDEAAARAPSLDCLRKWRRTAPDRYRFVIDENAGQLSWTATVVVDNDEIESVVFTDVFPDFIDPTPVTITGLFERIEQAFESEAETVQGTWDPTFGYPVTGFIDFSTLIADDQRSWTITDFEVL